MIVFSYQITSLGTILVARSSKGLCYVDFIDDQQSSLFFKKYNTRICLCPNDLELNHDIEKIVSSIEAPQKNPHKFQLEMDGTDFQMKVWHVLSKLKTGETISYQKLAEKIGNSKASRAVANACAANHLAVVVPCHRVLHNNGDISGYRWGNVRKKILLDREQKPESERVF
ncbi:methylated-DNA--[protein]-cysteine S-methyltransferase [Bartonella tamiae]|uniref:methylated-DNA--[protein]-cysteine S-methyltransferase n=1 Tax=Bartonella tamiae Th239 TaxID=1094558 RepID=J1K0M9_9HYPH|nr:methylated-DNA--[protein]-cysteine S-methyltransferase [Bartonella tamiae]EJF90590.1 methylated-DNA-[protein]-cysteine S-methyltransferase [Bartonella tamiae Th239]EJF94032.1 methylated-DNA-[protein]-cysteine S-methyltransferase [Bartonella tamiae Th307]